MWIVPNVYMANFVYITKKLEFMLTYRNSKELSESNRGLIVSKKKSTAQ